MPLARKLGKTVVLITWVVGALVPQFGAADELPPAAKGNPIVVFTRMAPGPDEDGPGRMLLERIKDDKTPVSYTPRKLPTTPFV